MYEFQNLPQDYSSIKQPFALICFKENCQNTPEYLCRCTDKWSLMCNIHIGDHIKFSPQSHTLESIFETVNCETQKALINFLKEEKLNLNEIQSKIVNKLTMTFVGVEDYVEKELNTIADEIKQIDNLIEIIATTTEISKINPNSLEANLILGPNEAIDKLRYIVSDKSRYFKVIEYIYSHDKNIENIIENIILQKIDKIFNCKLQKVLPDFDILNSKIFNLEESMSFVNHFKEDLNGKFENLIHSSNELKTSNNILKQEIEKTQKSLENQIVLNSDKQNESLNNEARLLSMIEDLKSQINNRPQQYIFYNQDEIERQNKKICLIEKQNLKLRSKISELSQTESESSEEEYYLPKKFAKISEFQLLDNQKLDKVENSPLKELLVYGLCNDDLRFFLEKCGNIGSIRTLKSNSSNDQNMAIVKFKNIEGQINALKRNKTFYKGEQAHVFSLNSKRLSNSFSSRIFVTNLPLNLEKEDVEDYFSEYGEIDQADIIADELGNATGCAWVKFCRIEDVSQIKKQNWISFEGRIIQIHYEIYNLGKEKSINN